jgi:hypothetical protein
LRPKNHFLAGLAGLSKNKKKDGCEGLDDLQVSLFAFHPGPQHREKYAISLLWLALFTDQFTFEDSLPRHARARPMILSPDHSISGGGGMVPDPEARAGLMVVTLWCQ